MHKFVHSLAQARSNFGKKIDQKLQYVRIIPIKLRMTALAGFGILSIAFLAGALFYSYSQLSNEMAALSKARVKENLFTNIDLKMLEMKDNEKDFRLTFMDDFLRTFRENRRDASALTAQLLDIVEADEQRQAVENIEISIQAYLTSMDKTTDIIKIIGTSLYDGYLGDMRSAASKMEKALGKLLKAEADNPDMVTIIKTAQTEFLKMSRQEKNYLLFKSQKYLDKHAKQSKAFEDALKLIKSNDKNYAKIGQNSTKYFDYFNKIGTTNAELDISREAMLAHIVTITDITKKLSVEARVESTLSYDTYIATEQKWNRWLSVFAVVMVLILLVLSYIIASSILKPLALLKAQTLALAAGELDTEISDTNLHDNIAEMANAMLDFKQNAIERVKLEKNQQQAQKKQAERAAQVSETIKDFEKNAFEVLNIVRDAATQLNESSDDLTQLSDDVHTQSDQAGEAVREVASNITLVAASTEELVTSIDEISQQANNSIGVAGEATSQIKKTIVTMNNLSDASDEISKVIKLIQDIAEQTNLLALNATIESARAGDAGKGFAVVAGEVKALAAQTASATKQISEQINRIQSHSAEATSSIENVNLVIAEMQDITNIVANAVTEQDTIVKQVAQIVNTSSDQSRNTATTMDQVKKSMNDSKSAAENVNNLSGNLTRQAQTLESEITRFLGNVQQA